MFDGLFVRIIVGLFINVCVIVICCFFFFDNLVGLCEVCLDKFKKVSVFLVFCIVLEEDVFVINVGIIIFFKVVNLGSNWWNWNIKLICWL